MNIPHMRLFNGIKITVGSMKLQNKKNQDLIGYTIIGLELKMDNFYEILELIYQLNKKVPEIKFGELIDTLYNKNIEDLYSLSNDELIKRLNLLLKDI